MSSPDILPPPPHDMQFACLSHIRDSYMFSIFFVSPGHHRTIQNLIPGWMTIVKLLKQVKNWQSPSRESWSNCLINSREDDKGQTNYYSGRQKDNSKTICGRVGYHAKKFISDFTKDADNPPLAIRDTWSATQSVLHSATPKQQLTATATSLVASHKPCFV